MPKSSDQHETKLVLMEAAVVEMAEKGWSGLRTRDVADRAQVNKALVHYHFGSIDNLRSETVSMLMSGLVNEAAATLLEAPTIVSGIREFGKHLTGFRSDDPHGVVLIEAMFHVPREEWLEKMMTRAFEVYENALRQQITTEIESGSLGSQTDPKGLATAIAALLDGLVLHAYMRPRVDFEQATEALAALIESGTKPERKRT